MNELQAVGTDPLRSNQLVLSQQEIYVGQELHVDSPWWSSMILFLAIGLGGFILWAALFEIDQSVRASGQIIPTARNQIVQVVDGGVLAELFIEEGDEVTQGQKLAVLEKELAQASFEEGRAQVAALRIALIRAQAEANRLEPQYRGEDLKSPLSSRLSWNFIIKRSARFRTHWAYLDPTLIWRVGSLTLMSNFLPRRM